MDICRGSPAPTAAVNGRLDGKWHLHESHREVPD
jgi:hypothetical protein